MTEVTRNQAAQRFELPVDGHTAFINYRQGEAAGDGRLLLVHTEVPEALGGKGVGSRLAKGTLDLLRSEGVKVALRCDFLRSYVDRHPDYRDMLA